MKKLNCSKKIKCLYSKNKELIILTILGLICLTHVFFTVFFYNIQSPLVNALDSVVRSQLSIIFGYLFGIQTVQNNNIRNKSFQFGIASFVSIICLICLISARWSNSLQSLVAIASIRDLMVSATGFILGCSRNKNS